MQNNNTFNKIAELAKRLIGTNLLWFLFNIPIVILSYYLLGMDNLEANYVILVAIALLMPFVFFPATSAMFGVLRKFVMGEEVPISQSFFKYYKANYVRSMSGGIIFVPLWALLAYTYISISDIGPLLNLLFLILAVILFVVMLNFFSMTVHMETKLFAAIKSSFIITFGGPILTVAVGIISAAIIYVSFNAITLLIPLFVGSVIANISFSGFYRVMLTIQTLKETQEEELDD